MAKTKIEQALNGEEGVIEKKRSSLKKSTTRKTGQLKGILIIEDNFEDPLPEELFKPKHFFTANT